MSSKNIPLCHHREGVLLLIELANAKVSIRNTNFMLQIELPQARPTRAYQMDLLFYCVFFYQKRAFLSNNQFVMVPLSEVKKEESICNTNFM